MGSPDDPLHAVERLTQGQIAVLQLVLQLRSSKEIGRELGISHHTVDQRLKRAQSILGVASRYEAARLYVASSKRLDAQNDVWGDLVYQSSELPIHPFPPIAAASPGEWNPAGDGGSPELRETQAQYFASDFGKSEKPSWYSVLFEASRSNELTPTARTAVIALIMFTSVLGLSALIGLAEGMSRIF